MTATLQNWVIVNFLAYENKFSMKRFRKWLNFSLTSNAILNLEITAGKDTNSIKPNQPKFKVILTFESRES